MSTRLRSTALALLLGVVAGACGEERPEASPATSTSTTPSTSTTTISATSTSTTAPRPSTTAPRPSTTTARPSTTTTAAPARPALPAGWELCTDRPGGYAVGYPGDWHTLRLESGNCHFFDPQPIVAPPNSDGIATWFTVFSAEHPRRSFTGPDAVDSFTRRILSSREVTFGGRTMLVRESEATKDVIFPIGTRYYGYFLDCGSRSVHLSTLSEPGRPESEYAAKKAVVDRAAPTLECLP